MKKECTEYISVDAVLRLRFVLEKKDQEVLRTTVHKTIEKMLRKSGLEKHVTRFSIKALEKAYRLNELSRSKS